MGPLNKIDPSVDTGAASETYKRWGIFLVITKLQRRQRPITKYYFFDLTRTITQQNSEALFLTIPE